MIAMMKEKQIMIAMKDGREQDLAKQPFSTRTM
jgi:hypothetical protein